MLKYADELLKVIESSSAHKQEVVIRTMGQVVASTGLVVEPYNKFPNLLMILLNMLVVEPEYSVRKEVGSVSSSVSLFSLCWFILCWCIPCVSCGR